MSGQSVLAVDFHSDCIVLLRDGLEGRGWQDVLGVGGWAS